MPLKTVASALETIGITKFGIIGGGAVTILGSQYNLRARQTDDLDIIIQPTTSMSAELVSRNLTRRETAKRSFISKKGGYIDKPHFILVRGQHSIHIPVEIFDWQVWPDRQQYYNLDWDGNAVIHILIHDQKTPVLNAGWLLRQKILAYAQRHNKNMSDMDDIFLLQTVLPYQSETITITDNIELEALRAVLNASNPPDLKEYVLCEAIWPPHIEQITVLKGGHM